MFRNAKLHQIFFVLLPLTIEVFLSKGKIQGENTWREGKALTLKFSGNVGY